MIDHNDGCDWTGCYCDLCESMRKDTPKPTGVLSRQEKLTKGLIMKLTAPAASTFEKCPAGNHLAVCVEIIDIGTQESTYQGKSKLQRKVWIGWETPMETDDDGKPYRIGRRYTFSGNEKSTLRKDIESWRGKAFTYEELENGFDMKSLLGKGCFINVVHTENDGKEYANIQSVAALPKGTSSPAPSAETIYLSLEIGEFDKEVYESLSDYMKGKISLSPEYKVCTTDTPF